MTRIRWQEGDPVGPLGAVLEHGGVLAVPTESSYALAVDPRNPRGVEAVYRCKERERGKPLGVVVGDWQQLATLPLRLDAPVLAAVRSFWPAPLSVALPVTSALAAAAGEGTLAVRVPAHRGLCALLLALGHPLTATSANRSGEPPLLDPAAVEVWLGDEAMVIDGGTLPGGAPSTLVAPVGGGRTLAVLRAGSFPLERLAPWLAAGR